MVIFTHLHNLPAGILQILCGAFCPEAMAGGSIGFLCSGRQAMRYGVSRGVFSNEAGLGAPESVRLVQIHRMRYGKAISA